MATKVTVNLDAVIEDDGNIYFTSEELDGTLIYHVNHSHTTPERVLAMMETLPATPHKEVTEKKGISEVIAKSNLLMAEVKNLRSRLS